MHLLREWLVRLWSTLRPQRSDRDLEAELRLHLEMEAERQIKAGESSSGAVRAAAIRAGGVAQAMEAARDRRGLPWLTDLARDLRYGLRGLVRDPTFSIVAIVSLALGIGANTAIFGLVDAVMLRRLPVRSPQELVFLEAFGSEGGGGAPPYPCFERFRRESSAFVGMSAFATDQLRIQVDGAVEQVFGQLASDNYFTLLGVAPEVGRLMAPGDEGPGPSVAVIGYGYWQRRFGGDPNVVGRIITFRNQPYTIVGVTPRSFWGLEPGRQVDLTLPITLERQYIANADDWWFRAVGRLRADAPADQATAQIDNIFQSYMKDRDTSGLRSRYFARMRTIPASHGSGALRARFGKPLYCLAVVAGLVLLIACANLGSLLLVRGAARGREFAIRLATGAGSGRLFRQLLTETGLLFVFGTAAGLAMAPAAIAALTGFFTVGRNPILLDVSLDWKLAAVAAGLALVAGLGTGLWPAVRALGTNPQATLRDGENRLAGSRRLAAAARALVVVQVAIAFVLVVTAVVFARTMVNLRAVDLGFRAGHVLTMSLDPILPEGVPAERRSQFWMEVLERVRALPGVSAASLSVLTPLSGRDTNRGIDVPGFAPRDPTERIVHVNHVSEDYFRTFGIGIVRGRAFTRRDGDAAARVLMINEAAAKAYFAGRDPIGSHVRFGKSDDYEVVGVVKDFKHLSVREAAPRFAFAPLWRPLNGISRITLAVMADRPGPLLVQGIAQQVHAVHAATLVSDVTRLEDQIDATLVSERLVSVLALGFATLALGLAAIGVYGVLSYSVAQRRAEFGIRSALGASRLRLMSGVLHKMLFEVAAGAAIGLPLAVIAARVAHGLLFDVRPEDPRQYLLGAVVLAVVVAAAAIWPVRQALSIDPAETLRRG
jgi:predicted permease